MAQVYNTSGQKSRPPAYYAVIPASVRYDDKLPANAKLLYGELSALVSKDGFCTHDDAYFAALYKMSERTISRLLDALVTRGHIIVSSTQPPAPGQKAERTIIILSANGGQSQDKKIPTRDKIVERLLIYINNKNIYTPLVDADDVLAILHAQLPAWLEKHKAAVDLEEFEPDISEWLEKAIPECDGPALEGKLSSWLTRYAAQMVQKRLKKQYMEWIEKYGDDWPEPDRKSVEHAIREFMTFRIELKAPLTQTALTGLLNRLNRFAEDNPGVMADMLYTAIDNGWRTIYPPRNSRHAPPNAHPMPSDGMEAF